MITALARNSLRVEAARTMKYEGPFLCPVCKEPVFMRECQFKVDHFAHFSDSGCDFGRGETQEHLRAKQEIYNALKAHPRCRNVELEPYSKGDWTDVLAEIGDRRVAIEVQRSGMDPREIMARTYRHNQNGMCVLWVVLTLSKRSSWQDQLYTMYYGKVYQWDHGAVVRPVHLKRVGWKRVPVFPTLPVQRTVHIASIEMKSQLNENPVAFGLVWMDRFGKWW